MREILAFQVHLGDGAYVLPGSELFFRDPKSRTILVWGHVIDFAANKSTHRKIFIELPQGMIDYQAGRDEIIERIATDQYQLVLVNGVVSNTQSAIFAVKNSAEPLIVTRDDNIFFVVKSTTEDGYIEITVELRY